jgi:hypothetical protein
MQCRDGRVGVIVFKLLGHLPQSINDPEDIDILRTTSITGFTRKTYPNGA